MSEQENGKQLPTWQELQNGLIMKALQDEGFRQELVANPKAVVAAELAKLGVIYQLPTELEIKVIEQPANALYLVLPISELSDEELDNVAGGSWIKCAPGAYQSATDGRTHCPDSKTTLRG